MLDFFCSILLNFFRPTNAKPVKLKASNKKVEGSGTGVAVPITFRLEHQNVNQLTKVAIKIDSI